jgi:RNA polymerase sigma-70 factor, ECF subfamily
LAVGQPERDDQITRLALAAGNGDQKALDAFIRATERDVWRCVAFLADPGSADDLTQETYLRALGALPRFTAAASARTWLLSIARRVVVDDIRRKQARPRTTGATDLEQVVESRRPGRRFEDIVEIRMLLDGLDPQRREALMLTQVIGLSYAEAADVSGCPVGTIRSRVARARDDLLAAGRADQTG